MMAAAVVRVPTDDRHKFGAERLHPATTNWCYRPIAAGGGFLTGRLVYLET